MEKQKLELTWVGKNKPVKLEPRLLLEVPEKSYHAKEKHEGDIFDNILIHGDNLLALKALESKFAGKVKCVYIDPPYNTGKAFEHYDDSLEHSIWLNLMRPRLTLLRNLLANEGLIFIQIDDNEYAYLKVLCDEIFGRTNYLNTLVIKSKAGAGASGGGEDKRLKKNYEFILVYVKDYDSVTYNIPLERIPLIEYIKDHKENKIGFNYTRVITNYGERKFLGTTKLGNGENMKIFEHIGFEFSTVAKLSNELDITQEEVYNRYINDIFMTTNAQTSLLMRVNDFVKSKNKLISYEYVPSTGKMKGKLETKMVWNETLVVWLKDSSLVEDEKIYKTEKTGTLWTNISWGRLDLEGGVSFKCGKKPETLIQKIFEMATENGDLVLDSFLGSGTTAAVAHKMKRRWIGIELEDHCYTHCIPRLKKVINGDDQSGITKSQQWQGGGGFRFYELAPSLIKKDAYGVNVIDSEHFDEVRLAEAVCNIMGFEYNPSQNEYFIHGQSTENAFIYVTTNFMNTEHIRSISQKLGNRHLSILCKAFDPIPEDIENITIAKIPKDILDKCEWGKDDYSLNVKHLPEHESNEEPTLDL